MRAAAALLAAALLLAGCGDDNGLGFSAKAPGGWKDETDNAETRTNTDFEAVYEGTTVDGVKPIITVARVESPKRSVQAAAAAARIAVDRRFEEADPTGVEPAEIAGEPAARFDYRAGEKRARYVTAKRGRYLYSVVLQSAATGFDRGVVVLDDFLAGWRWQAEEG